MAPELVDDKPLPADHTFDLDKYPDFYTSNADYFVTRIGQVPAIDSLTYKLEITGLLSHPHSFSLNELRALDLEELPLTIECIGNATEGPLVATAVWKGFNLYNLLISLGLDSNATGVKYLAADGYYASHTMEQLKDNNILGALFMNSEVIPPVQGFPLRILNPGYYGVKQPAWVTQIEVIDRPLEDYWSDRGWDTSPPMDVDTKIFFPKGSADISLNDTLEIGGAAFGGTRVASVEYTLDGGLTWKDAEIVKQINADNVWVFWGIWLAFPDSGFFNLNVRATDIHGNVQPDDDPDLFDGTNDWPLLRIHVGE
jgi:hypothetical protein